MKKKNSPVQSRKYPQWYYVILILIPAAILLFLEILLRITNYGNDNRQWIEINEDQITLNNYISRRYFPTTKIAPIVLSSPFVKIKKNNAYRVFILGESSAAGFPYLPNGSFSNYIEQRLTLVYPGIPIEVINSGITAVNSYAWLDLVPGIIEEKPDLIIIYGGHNEYYGAQGVASTESFGSSRFLIKLSLWINQFKTTELVRNTIQWITSIFSEELKSENAGTLMAHLSKGQHVKYESEQFYDGIHQFEENLREILQLTSENGIPVILSTLASNIKDQQPFVSQIKDSLPSASDVYKSAKNEMINGNIRLADSLFRLAKDLDLLKFRAPEAFNCSIKKLGEEFNYPVADADSLLKSYSRGNVIGNELMTDHLHPTLEGYQLMGKLFFEIMKEQRYLPEEKTVDLSDWEQDSLTLTNFKFSGLDSLIAEHRINILKNDWPYKSSNTPYLINLPSLKDSLAYFVAAGNLGWGYAHRIFAEYYLKNNNLHMFKKEYDVLINSLPYREYYERVTKVMVDNLRFEEAEPYLTKLYKIHPDAFNTKWLGYLELQKKENKEAINYFERSISFNATDPDVHYYLSGAYGRESMFDKALESINKCLQLSPNYPKGKAVLQLIQNEIEKRKQVGMQ